MTAGNHTHPQSKDRLVTQAGLEVGKDKEQWHKWYKWYKWYKRLSDEERDMELEPLLGVQGNLVF